MNVKDSFSLEENYDKPRQHIIKQTSLCRQRLHIQSYGFSSSCVWMGELDHTEGWVPKNWCFWILVLEKTLESPLNSKEVTPVNPKGNQPWINWKDWCWSSNTLGAWHEELTPWKRPWYWERLKAGEGDKGGWDGWMASLIQWTWLWANSGRQWRTGKPGRLQSMGLQSCIWLSHWTTAKNVFRGTRSGADLVEIWI